jgi:hypothetical protein
MGAARIVRREMFAWPGGYPLALVLSDGALLCSHCVTEEFSQVSYSARHKLHDGWRPEGLTILEDSTSDETCAHCERAFFEEC